MAAAQSRAAFITLEGGEGSGKTTQAAAIADSLRDQGQTVCATWEPGSTELGRLIQGILEMKEHGSALSALGGKDVRTSETPAIRENFPFLEKLTWPLPPRNSFHPRRYHNSCRFFIEGGILATRSAAKAHRQSIKRRLRNRAVKSATKTAI